MTLASANLATTRRSRCDAEYQSHTGCTADRDQVFKGRTLLWLAYQSIGVIYGDIGTSPLYVYSSTFSAAPSYDNLVGVLSLILWSLTMMVTVKYVLIILRADNDGEGGTFSTYSLLSRYVSFAGASVILSNRRPDEHHESRSKRVFSHTNETLCFWGSRKPRPPFAPRHRE